MNNNKFGYYSYKTLALSIDKTATVEKKIITSFITYRRFKAIIVF